MELWKPDPTFYPSPRMAMEAPPERLAYVALLNPKHRGKHDAMAVVDVDESSPKYGQTVGKLEMPTKAMSCTISDGMHAAPAFRLTRPMRTWSAGI